MSSNTIEKPSSPLLLQWCAGLFYTIFKFFASLKLAVFSLSSVMIVLITGTFIESYHGADAAKITVYDTWWFGLILLALGLNVLAAALDRIPWKKRHIGFVTTHAGIILILLGSFVSRQMMIDGQMAIAEGDTEYRITLPEPLVYVFSEARGRDWIVPVRKKAFPWEGKQRIADREKNSANLPLSIDLISYYPKARMHEEMKLATEGSGALKLRIKSSFFDQTLWLVEKDAERGRVQMGPAIFSFSDEPLREIEALAEEVSYLEIKLDAQTFAVPLEGGVELPFTFPLKGTGYEVTVNKLYAKAAVIEKELVDQTGADAPENPAAQITLTGPDFKEDHTVFAKFPNFPTVHGMKPSAIGANVLYRLAGGGSKGESLELRFVKNGEALQYQAQDGLEITSGEVAIGESVSTGWADLSFTVEEYLPFADFEHHYTPMDNTTEFEGATPALQLRVEVLEVPVPNVPGSNQTDQTEPGTFGTGTLSKNVWLGQGIMEKTKLGESVYHLMYGQRRIPAGFKIELKDFKIEKYPGTNNPASYESDVVLKDDVHGAVKDVTISMNEPLAHRGFKVYQSGYSLEEGKEVSIFSVGRNPGIPYQYGGTIVMVIGIMTMFYTRKFSRAGGKL